MLAGIIFFLFFWAFGTPNLSPEFGILPLLLLGAGLVWTFVAFSTESNEASQWGSITLTSVSAVWLAGLLVASLPAFRADSYRAVIGNVETAESTASGKLEKVSDPSHIRTVDIETARSVMTKKLGEVQALGSQFSLGDPDVQRVGSGLYWVAPLEYRGFFKWSSSDGVPAYAMVSASDQGDAKLVTSYGSGNSVKLKYSPSAFFGEDLKRHVYFSGYMARGLADYSFEVDDAGKPYWVITTFVKKVGIGGSDADGVVVVDAETGSTKWYATADVPEWVDRVQPESFVAEQLDDWGEYVHGWANPSNKDRLQLTTRDLRLTYGTDGRPYWYAGVANYGAPDSSVNGFVLVDTVTKKATFHKESGASETAAQRSAEGKVQQMGYVATNPVLYSVAGTPTYVMALKDKAGLMKQVAFVSVKDFSVVGIGETSEEAYGKYRKEMSSNRNASAPGPSDGSKEFSGKVSRVSPYSRSGDTEVLFVSGGKKFTVSAFHFPEAAMLRDGDSVKIRYSEDDRQKGFYRVSSFEGAALTETK